MKSKYVDCRKEINIQGIIEAAETIKDGKLVLFPTETVYGIGANALDKNAVQKIFMAKGRASDNPLIVHVTNITMLEELVDNVGEIEEKLINAFWPGPLTIIFEKKAIVPNITTGGLNTVAVRMPSNEIARKLIEFSMLPIAAPSANVSGKPSGTKIEDIISELDGKVDFIIDEGKVEIGVESTVVRVVDGIVRILRPGKITPKDIENLGLKVEIEKQILGKYVEGEKVLSPGIKYKHYAPTTKCILVYSQDENNLVNKIQDLSKNKHTVIICKTQNAKKYKNENILEMGNTLEEIMSNIFTLLRKADTYGAEQVIIEGVEKEGLGLAIMNRLLRACAHNYIEC